VQKASPTDCDYQNSLVADRSSSSENLTTTACLIPFMLRFSKAWAEFLRLGCPHDSRKDTTYVVTH
jgi:hypothetical protein